MKYRNQVVLLVVVGAAFGVGRWTTGLEFSSQAVAQPDKKAPAQPAPDLTKMGIGAEHKVLDVTVGDWAGTVKMWGDPAGAPQESKGKIHREWVLDGHFVHAAASGDPVVPGGAAYQGMGVMGYNSAEKRYEAGWVTNMGTAISFATGKYDAAKKTFTYESEVLDPKSGQHVKHREVLDCSTPDREVMAGYNVGSDGKEVKMFEATFDRVKK